MQRNGVDTLLQSCLIISNHLKEYLQIEHDNPNLIWLYTLILQDEVDLPRGEVILAMKQRLLEENSLTQLAWRFIANGTADDFRVVLESRVLGEEPQWRWHTLRAWLQVLSGLRLSWTRNRDRIGEPLAQNNFLPLLESLCDAGYSVSL
jgi:hypothetical protein